MNNNKEVSRFINIIQDQTGYYNAFGNLLYLVFIKFFLDKPNKVGKTLPTTYETLYEFRTKMSDVMKGSVEFSLADFERILHLVDIQINDPSLPPFLFHDSANYLFSLFSKKDSQKIVFSALNDFCLPNNKDEMIEFLECLLDRNSRDVTKTADRSTPKAIRKIVSRILCVTSIENYADPFCGYSTSLLDINNFSHYYGFDISHDAILISTIVRLLLGIERATLEENSICFNPNNLKFEKIFADPPANIKNFPDTFPNEYSGLTKDINVAYLYKIVDSLSDNGVAVITAPTRTLFSSVKGYVDFRKKYAAQGLKAVIELPALCCTTSTPTNLLVFQTGYKGNIIFLSAKDRGIKENGLTTLDESTINEIVETVYKNISLSDISISVERERVINSDSWIPNKFLVKQNKNFEHRKVSDIDVELNDLYQQFFDNNK